MKTTFLGKCHLRPVTLPDGSKKVCITGIFDIPDYETITDDEMWALRFEEIESRRFHNPRKLNFSPEDFLANVENIQDPSMWDKK